MTAILIIFGSMFAAALLQLAATLLFNEDNDNDKGNDKCNTDWIYIDDCM